MSGADDRRRAEALLRGPRAGVRRLVVPARPLCARAGGQGALGRRRRRGRARARGFGAGGSVLELAAGTGLWTRHLVRHGRAARRGRRERGDAGAQPCARRGPGRVRGRGRLRLGAGRAVRPRLLLVLALARARGAVRRVLASCAPRSSPAAGSSSSTAAPAIAPHTRHRPAAASASAPPLRRARVRDRQAALGAGRSWRPRVAPLGFGSTCARPRTATSSYGGGALA